ncbi:hypothetical protein ACFO1B_07245 [Dactylosporangium siamense]|uniref:Uncharacterized protein n=1 Tax=Dactylosporangium siamense TaxID=685454 RepID=A0A919U9A1_9ACTN|nr:hypothetical protein [Dactylosporangium siamense]GIG43555.1 hypothetical protein Dsi01nite_015960 [Dactylosporangium siamense]
MTIHPAQETPTDDDLDRWAPAPDASSPGPLRRRAALALVVLSVATLVIVIVGLSVVRYTSWRFVGFIPMELPSRWTPTVAAAFAGLAAAALLGLRNRTAAKAAAALSTIVLLFTGCVGGAANIVAKVDRDVVHTDPSLVATAPGGDLELVLHYADARHYRLRTTGWLGREGQTDVVCASGSNTISKSTGGSGHEDVPAVLLASVRFTDATHLSLVATDGRTWTVTVDDVNPDRTVNLCDSSF